MKKIELDSGFSLFLKDDIFDRGWTNLILSLPEIGLVGLLALRHLEKRMNLQNLGFALSENAALLFKYENGEHVPNIRFVGGGDMLLLILEYPITPSTVIDIGKMLVELIEKIKPKMIFMLGSTPSLTRERKGLDEINVFGAPSSQKLVDLLEENGVQIVKNGTLSGPFAYVLNYSVINGWDSVALLSETYPAPIGIDPESAAKLLKVLGGIIGIEIDVSELKERAEELKLEMRKLEQLAAPHQPREIGQLYT